MDKFTMWVQIDTDGDIVDKDDLLDFLHEIRKEDIVDFVDNEDIEVKLREDA